ncbi:hypothetical protein F7984_11080 [Pradoshia sp. D12]|uniref:YpjP family protein n=1 Tax=Bacillaceae TaxID=186817 RepID=UPI00111F5DE1|nr:MULTISPECIES: YpjP family protein [Bacillaceae]QFK71733.1 hypothetical protein F7984_11080 [Pradoshia sp. D12]TPF73528.1 hypothetical protein FHY44_07480 [Bacillus sp. D12]
MKNWSSILKKSLVVGLSVLSFGIISPSQYQEWYEGSTVKEAKNNPVIGQTDYVSSESPVTVFSQSDFLSYAMLRAEEQSFEKFGSRIGPHIKDEFYTSVLPNIESALQEFSSDVPEEKLLNMAISEKPSGGLSEKIFHVYDRETNEDLIRFHVRRENPPGEGHWFEFHYHTYKDNFDAHHSMARIYWSQNTPPKWIS